MKGGQNDVFVMRTRTIISEVVLQLYELIL